MVVKMINTLTFRYISNIELEHFILQNDLQDYPHIFIQVFSSNQDEKILIQIQKLIQHLLPQGKLIGCTTAGEIYNGDTLDNQTTITFTIFEKTQLECRLYHVNDENTFQLGKTIYHDLCHFETKALIIFATDYSVQIDQIVKAIYEENKQIKIAGGIASPLHDSESAGIVLNNDEISNRGVVVAVFNNPQLKVETFTNYQMQEIGKTFHITKAKDHVIYSIDKKKPLQILKQYLGDHFVQNMREMCSVFPFVLENREGKKPIYVTKVLENGAIEVNHHVKNSDQLTFAFIDIHTSIEKSIKEFKRISKENMETIFLYSCFTRKKMIGPLVMNEVAILQSLAPTNGFFAWGEISTGENNKPQLLGQALTYLALSESKKRNTNKTKTFQFEPSNELNTLITLTHLMHASQKDIKQLNESIQISEQYYRSLFDNNADIVYSTDLQGRFTSVNAAFEKCFGYKKDEMIGKSALKFIYEEDIPRVKRHFYRALKGREQYYNIEVEAKNGEKLLFHFKNIPITVNGECVGIYGLGRNITEQKKIEDRIIQLAHYDQDTGLPNRVKFTEKLAEMIDRAERKKRKLAVLVLDLDRFKIVNDSFGHDAGDEVLKEIADRIMQTLPYGAYLGRFSGDKFNIALSKNVEVDETIKIAKNILRKIAEPVYYRGQEFYVTASIGISFYPNDGENEVQLLKNADIAMNRSKYPGGNRITLYSNEMNNEAIQRLELESHLRKALKNNEFFLCYQPFIDLHTSKVYGCEALIRWQHPTFGLVSPGQFIPLAEEIGLIEEIGNWVLRTACKQNKRWHDLGHDHLIVSVNVSAQQFQQQKFVKEVENALKESGLAPQYLSLELTESIMLQNIDHSIEVMTSLQKLGVHVSIDDFGTGYSSLSYLKNLPINTLKIDRSFINNLRIDTSDIAIVKAIITMGHGLALKVVAEGVETEEQIKLLKELKCHYAQGFYLYRPIPANEFEEKVLSLSS